LHCFGVSWLLPSNLALDTPLLVDSHEYIIIRR
jgi:hypothetical protein